MKKRPLLVITGTVLGTVGVLSYAPGMTTPSPLLALSPTTQNSTPPVSTPPTTPPTSPTTSTPPTSATPTPPAAAPTSSSSPQSAPRPKKSTTAAKARTKPPAKKPTQAPPATATSTATPTPTSTQTTTTVRKIAGSTFQTPFGPVQVQITVQGTKIISVSALQSPQGGRSSYINQQAVPYLIQETLAAQSANIQGVGGATYTSEGWAQSLQAALAKI